MVVDRVAGSREAVEPSFADIERIDESMVCRASDLQTLLDAV